MLDHDISRRQLDQLLFFDAVLSVSLGVITLIAPHSFVAAVSGGYNHGAHEALRLYACLRIAVGWILLHVRSVDDGRFRRSVCEALCACYALQSAVVLRAQFTDRSNLINWLILLLLAVIGIFYGRFRFGNGGHLIKIYELPTSSSLS